MGGRWSKVVWRWKGKEFVHTFALGRRCGSPLVWPGKGCTPNEYPEIHRLMRRHVLLCLSGRRLQLWTNTPQELDREQTRLTQTTQRTQNRDRYKYIQYALGASGSGFKLGGSRGDKEKGRSCVRKRVVKSQRYSWYCCRIPGRVRIPQAKTWEPRNRLNDRAS